MAIFISHVKFGVIVLKCYGICFILILFVIVKCVNSKSTPRLLGGRDAEIGEFPYVVRVEVQTLDQDINTKTVQMVFNAHVCTGSAIAATWTLTAAHCVVSVERAAPLGERAAGLKPVIRYGAVVDTPELNASFSDIIWYVKHHSYRVNLFKKRQIAHSDIGLLRTEPIKLKQYGKMSAVDYGALIGHEAVVVGFGLTQGRQQDVSSTLTLKKPLQVTNVVMKTCDKEALFTIYPVVCVARACGRSVTLCPGDSGGPLVHPSGIVAVNSMAAIPDCFVADGKLRSNVVGLMTPTSTYIDWILSFINKHN